MQDGTEYDSDGEITCFHCDGEMVDLPCYCGVDFAIMGQRDRYYDHHVSCCQAMQDAAPESDF